jgi:hypothetical protein
MAIGVCDPPEHTALPATRAQGKRCPSCGRQMSRRASRCRACWLLQAGQRSSWRVFRHWTREQIIEAACNWTTIHGSAPTTSQWARASSVHPPTLRVYRCFGSWACFLEAAGLGDQAARRWNRETIAAAVLTHLTKTGRLPTATEWARAKYDAPSYSTVVRFYDRWNNAMQAAWDLRRRINMTA